MTLGVAAADALYRVSAETLIERECVDDADLRGFSLGVRRFVASLGDDASEPYWKPVLARLRRVRWELATVPLPPGHPALGLEESAQFISRKLRHCEKIYPQHAEAARKLAGLLGSLAERDSDPLGVAVRALCGGPRTGALVLRDGRHASDVERHFAKAANVAVVVPSELGASAKVYDRAIVVGPSTWFPRTVFGAPKSREIRIVQFDWLRDSSVSAGVFVSTETGDRSLPAPLPAYDGSSSHGGSMESVDLLPVTDWPAIAAGTDWPGGGVERPDTVDAYLFLLASEQAIYMEAEQGSRAYVVELGEGQELHTVPTEAIKPGTYIVTRVGGEGDYIPAIADGLLGGDAERLREAQRYWKEKLRGLIDPNGMNTVVSKLKAAGSPRASRGNVRRWASGSAIRTEDRQDFAAIMHVAGMASKEQELWEAMHRIDQAHLRAGQVVRKLLNREIRTGDTRELERRGWQDYEVEEIDGEGALRVARVEARAPDIMRISARQTRELFDVERDLWQG